MEPSTRRTHVLIVDDEPAIRFGIRSFLEAFGYQVTEAETCAEGLAAFQARRPDVAVLDYQLPDGTSLELLARLMQPEEHRAVGKRKG